jgi:hypothetical protein
MQIERFAKITAGLAAAGAAAGSVVGFGFAMCMTALSYLTGSGPESLLFLLMAIVFVTGAGAVAGATLGPPAAWLLMRHVPLGRAVSGAALGALAATVAGSVLGLLAGWGDNGLLIYPLLGFGASTAYLSVSTPRRSLTAGAGSGQLHEGGER